MKFKQIMYCAEGSNYNFPNTNDLREQLINGTIFSGMSIYQLGVQAPPGTKFYVNNNDNPVIVGYSGLFDLDLTDGGSIYYLSFERESINKINETETAILIVDILYLDGGD